MHTMGDKILIFMDSEVYYYNIDVENISGLEKVDTRWEEFFWRDEDQENKSIQEYKYLHFKNAESLNKFKDEYERRKQVIL